MKIVTPIGLLLLCCVQMLCTFARADDSRPLYVEVTELEASSHSNYKYKLQWRIPPTVSVTNAPAIHLPDSCENANNASQDQDQARASAFMAVQQRLYRCSASLEGQVISIDYPGVNPAVSTLIKFKAWSGEQHTRMLSPEELSWRIPEAETKSQVVKDYTWLGIYHIWAGIDHL